MRIRTAPLATAAVLAFVVAGCGKDTCPTESPQVSDLVTDCRVLAGQTSVTFPLHLCPTCNQTLTGCTADMSAATAAGGVIFLNPTVEACSSSSSCGAGCSASNATCTFTPPGNAAGVSYTVQVYDPGSAMTKSGTLTFVSGSASCAF